MRSACAIGFGLAVLFASGMARAQQDLTTAKPIPSVTIIVIQAQPGVVVGPAEQGGPTGVWIGWTPLPPRNNPAVVRPTSQVNAPSPLVPHAGRFQAMDTNKDGRISRAEFKGPSDVFASVDADHDGSITKPEATRAYLAFVGLLSLQEKAKAFRTMDANKDGQLSQAEFKGPKAAFARLDANHDGLITRAEAVQAFHRRVGRAMAVARLRSMDANHDGLISATEFKGPMPAFAKLDVDQNGTISRAELAKVFQTPNARHASQTTQPIATAPKIGAATTTPVTLGPWAKRILAMDTNKDGKVCKAEFLKGLEARFDYLDQDKDGSITTADITKVVQARKMNPALATRPVAARTTPRPSATP